MARSLILYLLFFHQKAHYWLYFLQCLFFFRLRLPSSYGVDVTFKDSLAFRAGIFTPGHCFLINCFQTKPHTWIMENETGCYDVVSGLLFHSTLTGCCGSNTPSVHWRMELLMPVWRQLSLIQDGLDRYIFNGLWLTLKMKVCRQEVLLCHSVF